MSRGQDFMQAVTTSMEGLTGRMNRRPRNGPEQGSGHLQYKRAIWLGKSLAMLY